MKVKNTHFVGLPWYKKPFPRIVQLRPGPPETYYLALSLKNSDEFIGINLTSLKTTYPTKNTEVYKVDCFEEYNGIITLSNDN